MSEESIETVAEKKEIFPTLLAAICACIAAYLWSAAFWESPVTPDTGYTLPMAQRIADGAALFRDLGVQHTTSLLFILAGFQRSLGYVPSYEEYLGLLYIVTFVILFLIAGLISVTGPIRRDYMALSISLAALGIFGAEGWTINIEPFVLLFGLTSHLILLEAHERKSYYILSGLLAGLAFITKQYGLFILGSSLLLVLTRQVSLKERISCCIFLGLSFLTVPLFYLDYLATQAPGGMHEVLFSFSGRWYQKDPGNYLTFLWMMISVTPFVCFVPFALKWKDFQDNEALRLSLFAFLMTMLQGLVRQYFHYYLHVLPYAVALSAALILKLRDLNPRVTFFALILGSAIVVDSAVVQYVWTGTPLEVRTWQRKLAINVSERLPAHTRVFLIGPPFFLYLCNLWPPDDHIPGYNFLQNYTPEEMLKMLEQAEYLLEWGGDNDQLRDITKIFADKGYNFQAEVNRLGFKKVTNIVHGPSGITMVTFLKRTPS